jgi:hypothetical protein
MPRMDMNLEMEWNWPSDDQKQQVTSAFVKSTQLPVDEAETILSAYRGNLDLALEYFYMKPWTWPSEDQKQQVTAAFMKSTQLSDDEAERILSAYRGNLHLALEYFYSFRTWVTNGVWHVQTDNCRLPPNAFTHAISSLNQSRPTLASLLLAPLSS